jgi:hypothetical protein
MSISEELFQPIELFVTKQVRSDSLPYGAVYVTNMKNVFRNCSHKASRCYRFCRVIGHEVYAL